MSMSLRYYLGYGLRLDMPAAAGDEYDFIEAHKEYSQYGFENPDADKPGVRVITRDGADPYLLYVLEYRDQEDMWNGDAAVELPFDGMTSDMLEALAKAFKEYSGESLGARGISLVSLFVAG